MEQVNVLEGIIKNAEIMQVADDDYVGDDGYLYCGKCHTRKQYELDMSAFGVENKKVPVPCSCKEAEINEAWEQKKKADAQYYISRLRELSLMDKRFDGAYFVNYLVGKDNERVYKIAKRYVSDFDGMLEKNQGLLFYGDVGTGKTYTAACIANELLQKQISVTMTSFVKLLDKMQGFQSSDDKMLYRLSSAKLLVIDDLGVERNTEYALERVYDIIDSRYRAKLPMVLTTNLGLAEMKNATDIKFRRIYDRILESCYPVEFKGKSYRMAEASKRYREMKTLLEGE